MSTSMQQAFDNQQRTQQRRPTAPPTALQPRSRDEILADAKARMAARRERARQTPDIGTTQVIVALLESREMFQAEYDELERNRVMFPDATRQLAEISRELDQVKVDLDYFVNPKRVDGESDIVFEGRRHQSLLSVEKANRSVALRSAARSWTEAIRATATPDSRAITRFLEDAEASIGPFVTDVDEKSPKKVTTWKGRHLGSAVPEDEVITEVVKTFGEMVKSFTDRKEKEGDDVVQLLNHAGYYISDDAMAELRRSSDSTNLTRFLGNGEGKYAIVSYKYGEALALERHSGGVYPYKASGPQIGRMAFLFKDRNTGTLKAIEHDRLRPLEHDGTDVKKVWHDQLREALEYQLRREAEGNERRQVSRKLTDMSSLADPITTYELSVLNKVGTCLMNYRQQAGERSTDITYRLSSDGIGAWVSGFVPGAIEKADPKGVWLAKMLDPNNPFPISELRKLDEWKKASRANSYCEAEWQTERETKRLNATAVTQANQNGFLSKENGVDGIYTFTTSCRRRNAAENVFWVNGGFAVERKGSQLKAVSATPAVQREFGRMGKEFVEIDNLPNSYRDVLRSLYLGVNKLRGFEAWKQAPTHLQRVMTADSNGQQEETEE